MAEDTCISGAPAFKNCRATSAESIPPVASIGYPGKALAVFSKRKYKKGDQETLSDVKELIT